MVPLLRPVEPQDRPFLEILFREVRAPEFAPLGLPEPMLHQLLDLQFRSQISGYAAQFPDADDQLILIDEQPAGRLLVHRSPAEIKIVDLALLTSHQGVGAGTHLLRTLAEESASAGIPLRLTVRFDNPARRLYERIGFRHTGGDGLNLNMELPGHTAVPAPVLPVEEQDAVGQEFSSRYFRTLLGQRLAAHAPDGTTAHLVLNAVDPLPGHGPATDNFSLQFSGPLEPCLPSACLELTPEGQAPMTVFLVPNGPRDGAMRYEAIFNRI